MSVRWFLLAGLALLVGCGRGSELQRVIISGTVSYQGKPIPDGVVVFVPIKGTNGPGASGIIKEGVYKVTAGGGVPVGIYRVEIQALRRVPQSGSTSKRPGPLQDLPPKESYLPEKYNRNSTMEVTIEDKGQQTRDFDLK